MKTSRFSIDKQFVLTAFLQGGNTAEIFSSLQRISIFKIATVTAVVFAPFFWASAVTHAQVSDPKVCISDGCLLGTELSGGVNSFLGIPYAAPPTGDRRFRPPHEPIPWLGDRTAKSFGPVCPRLNDPSGPVNGDEDCLTLNVWAPAGDNSASPVVVFIHPGLNSRGTARQGTASYGQAAFITTTWDGQPWAAKGIVFVSVEWRVNALGFLAHPALSAEDPEGSSGNYGVLDQIAALRWVHKNIASFGGDPANVTLLGATAGAADVSVIVVSDLANGLFSHAILESPIWSRFPTLQQAEQSVGAEIVQLVGCATAVDVAACLRAKPFEDIVRAAPFKTPSTESVDYAPRIDGWVLKGDPVDLIEGDLAPNKAPLMIGSTAEEMNAHALDGDVGNNILPPDADRGMYQEALVKRFGAAAAEQIYSLYPESDFVDSPLVQQLGKSPSFAAMLRVVTDSLVTCPVRALARRGSTGDRPIYRYFFTHVPNIENNATLNALGAFDNEDNWFIFKASPYIYSTDELNLAATMQAYWAAFATTGTPNGGNRPWWPAYERFKQDDNFLEINSGVDSIKVGNGVRTIQCNFWNFLDQKLQNDK
jgi:para-nitrobenzyl esterase